MILNCHLDINETHQYLYDKFINNNIKIEKFTEIINKLKSIEYNMYLCPSENIGISGYTSCFY